MMPAATRAPGRTFLCDQSMLTQSGHCFAYFEPLAAILRARGREVVMVGNKGMDAVVAAAGVVPGFTLWCDERSLGQPPGLDEDSNADHVRDAHEAALDRDLRALDQRFRFRRADRLVVNTIRHWAMRAVVHWLDSLPEDACPDLALILHFTPQPEPFRYDPAMRHYRDAFAAIERSARRNRIRLYADATTLIDDYRALTSLDVRLAPFPHGQSTAPVPGRVSSGVPGGDANRIRIGYAGEARFHKGFHLLPFIAEQLARTDLADQVEFHVHSFVFNRDAEFYRQTLAQLRARPNVVLYPDILDTAAYERFIANCDLVLILYSLSQYHRQTSGILADALGQGVPVVVTRGTWMAREVRRLGGGVCANPEDYMSAAEATYRACKRIDALKAEARRARDAWRAFNTPENLVNMLEAQ